MSERPKKLYYTISEVAELTGVKPHVLRYWESEFPSLRPGKTRSGSRRYRQRDIDEILAIKRLLYEEGYRISGARKMRRQAAGESAETPPGPAQLAMPFADLDPQEQLAHVRGEIAAILHLVQDMGGLRQAGAVASGAKEREAAGEA
jgi:DNA-binding transcriptional MerR regulator